MDEAVQAGRVIVMDGGHVLLSGEPREVFSQVELLKNCLLYTSYCKQLHEWLY